MSIRQEMGLAIKNEAFVEISKRPEVKRVLEVADKTLWNIENEGFLFVWNSASIDSYFLEAFWMYLDKDDYLFVRIREDQEVKSDGDWDDNPWNLGHTVRISYNEGL